MKISEPPICDIRLTPQAIEAILEELDGLEREVPESKRRSERFPLRGIAVNMELTCVDHLGLAPGRVIRVRLRNVSQHGLAFLSGVMVPLGANLTLRLPIGQKGEMVEKRAVVVRCRHVKGMVHEVGAEFGWRSPDQPLPGKDADEAADESAPSDSADPT